MENLFMHKNKKPPRYFPGGVLMFQESGHTLTKDKDHYVCSQKQKGKCKESKEKRIKAELLERNFSRLAMKFSLPEGNEDFFMRQVVAKIFHTLIDESITNTQENDQKGDLFRFGVEALEAENKAGNKKEFERAFKDTKDGYMHQRMEENKVISFTAILLAVTMTFAKNQKSEAEIGKVVAYLSKEVYLSDDGKILNIHLHKLGNYIIQYIEKYVPEYTKPSREFLVEVDKFDDLEFKTVIRTLKNKEMEDILPYDPFSSAHGIMKFGGYIFGNLMHLNPNEAITNMHALETTLSPNLVMSLMRLGGKASKSRKK